MSVKTTTATTYAASATSFAFGLTANEMAALGGLAVAVATFLVNFWFQWRRDQREIAAGRGSK